MRIVVTGASGFIGRQLVPDLLAAGHEVLVVGRDRAQLDARFPRATSCTYGDLSTVAAGFDCLVHLAVVNNDSGVTEAVFDSVNVGLFRDVIGAARAAGISRLVNVTSFHALEDGPDTAYARSKRRALKMARAAEGIDIVHLFLPAVYGPAFSGRLRVVERMPAILRRPMLTLLTALAPSLHASRLVAFLERDVMHVPAKDEVFLADPVQDNPVYRAAIRVLDIGFALVVVLLFWWLLALVWALVRTGSPGPGIFAQERIGRHGVPFVCYKFRTMREGTMQAGTHEVSASSVTSVGGVLRKTKIDELPQVWNILRGDLSLVGPRPCLPVQVDLIAARDALGVFAVRPGITGLAQIRGVDMRDPVRLARLDAQYVARQCLLLDLTIFAATLTGSGRGDRVKTG